MALVAKAGVVILYCDNIGAAYLDAIARRLRVAPHVEGICSGEARRGHLERRIGVDAGWLGLAFVEEQGAESRLVAVVSFRADNRQHALGIRHRHAFAADIVVVRYLENRHIAATSPLGNGRPFAVFACDVFPLFERYIFAKVILGNILEAFHQAVVESAVEVVALLPRHLADGCHSSDAKHAVRLVASALLDLPGFTAYIIRYGAVVFGVQVEFDGLVIHLAVVPKYGKRHICLGNDRPPVAVGICFAAIECVHYREKDIAQHGVYFVEVAVGHAVVCMAEHLGGICYLPAFEAGEQGRVVGVGNALESTGI